MYFLFVWFNDAVLLKALEMARLKYGKNLKITGDEDFKSKVIQLVHKHQIDITFKDFEMEKELKRREIEQKESRTNKRFSSDKEMDI